MSYSEAITKNDLQKILNTFGYADNDWTTPNITYGVSDKTEKTSTAQNTYGTTLVTINHTTQTGRFLVLSSAVIKTSRYTSYTTIAVNGQGVGTEWAVTNLTTPTTVHNVVEIKNKEIGSSHIIELKLSSQDSGTTATRPAYNPSILCAIDILDTKAKGSRILECYPVGSYYETSDANFNPNNSWGGTWVKLAHNTLLTSLTYKPNGNTTAIGNITIPVDGYYMFLVGWNNGKPLFAGLSTDTQSSPTQVIYDGTDSGGSYNVVMYMTAGTKKIWVRAQSATANNTFYVYKVNYLNDNVYRWQRTA